MVSLQISLVALASYACGTYVTGLFPDHARLAPLTGAVVMVLASANPGSSPVLRGALRFVESCIGPALAVLAVLVTPAAMERPT